jgi:hypothetical protein
MRGWEWVVDYMVEYSKSSKGDGVFDVQVRYSKRSSRAVWS